jgi:hypothetical protein
MVHKWCPTWGRMVEVCAENWRSIVLCVRVFYHKNMVSNKIVKDENITCTYSDSIVYNILAKILFDSYEQTIQTRNFIPRYKYL